jgi:ribonuclease BN (tRNA processing enzyme)
VKITVLGSCAAWPEPGRACAGFLVEHAGFRLVLDLGFGTLPRLLALCPNGDVDAVVVTHQHSDHCVDLNGLLRVRSAPAIDPRNVVDELARGEEVDASTEVKNGFRKLGEGRWVSEKYVRPLAGSTC